MNKKLTSVLFSRKEFRAAWVSEKDIASHAEKTEWRIGDGFTEK
jgi:hypothetical protein